MSSVRILYAAVFLLSVICHDHLVASSASPQRRQDGFNPPPKHSFSHQLVETEIEEDEPTGFFAGNRDARSFWKNLLRPVFLRTTKNRQEKKLEDKKDDSANGKDQVDKGDMITKATTFGPPVAESTKSAKDETTAEAVPTAIPVPDDYEKTIQQQAQSQSQHKPSYLQGSPSFGSHGTAPPAGHDPFAMNPMLGTQTSPFGFSIPGATPGGSGGPHPPHRPPFGRPQSGYQQYLLQQYGSAFDQQKPSSSSAGPQHQQLQQLASLLQQNPSLLQGGGASGSAAALGPLLNDPRLLMMLMMKQRELKQGNELPGAGGSSAELKQEERALMDIINALADRTGISSFNNLDRLNLDFLNPFRNRFTLPVLNFLSGQSKPYMATAKIFDNGAPGAPPTVAAGTLTFYQRNAASPIQVEVDLHGIGFNARNIRIDIRQNIPLANCAGQGDIFNPAGRSSGGVVLTIGASDAGGRLMATIDNLPRESVSIAAPHSIIGKSVQISEAGVIHGCGTILAANALPSTLAPGIRL